MRIEPGVLSFENYLIVGDWMSENSEDRQAIFYGPSDLEVISHFEEPFNTRLSMILKGGKPWFYLTGKDPIDVPDEFIEKRRSEE